MLFVTRLMDFASVVLRGLLGLESDGQAVAWTAWLDSVTGVRRLGIRGGGPFPLYRG